jgi:hypothetical protein
MENKKLLGGRRSFYTYIPHFWNPYLLWSIAPTLPLPFLVTALRPTYPPPLLGDEPAETEVYKPVWISVRKRWGTKDTSALSRVALTRIADGRCLPRASPAHERTEMAPPMRLASVSLHPLLGCWCRWLTLDLGRLTTAPASN